MTNEEAIEILKKERYGLLEILEMPLDRNPHGTIEALDIAIEALTVHKKGEWIPVSERLPEDGEWAIFTDGSTISVERYKADAIDHFYPQGRWFSFDKATAWLPLPEPYKAESEGGKE